MRNVAALLAVVDDDADVPCADGRAIAGTSMKNSTQIALQEVKTFDIGSDTCTGVAAVKK